MDTKIPPDSFHTSKWVYFMFEWKNPKSRDEKYTIEEFWRHKLHSKTIATASKPEDLEIQLGIQGVLLFEIDEDLSEYDDGYLMRDAKTQKLFNPFKKLSRAWSLDIP